MSQEAEPPLAHCLDLHADIARRLAASTLPPAARALIDGALSSLHAESAASVGGVYLKSVAAKGFRGVGPQTRLDFRPGPGLTVVTGRNGSGKSSFAEAIDVALTGENRRWAGNEKAQMPAGATCTTPRTRASISSSRSADAPTRSRSPVPGPGRSSPTPRST